MKTRASLFRLFLSIVIIVLLLPVLAHFVLGSYNRALADDFCFTADAWLRGLWGTLDWYYNNWTGTYSSTFFQSSIGVMQVWRYMPLILVGLFSAACWWAAWQFAVTFRLAYRRYTAAALGFLLAFGAISGTANVFQSFYWTSGGVTYTSPMIVLIFHAGLLLAFLRQDAPARWWQYVVMAVLPLFSGGFAPLYAVFQVAAFGVTLALAWRCAPQERRTRALRLLAVGWVFALIALLILLAAPGNVTRQAAFDDLLPLPQAILQTLTGTLSYIPTALVYLSPWSLIVPFFLAGLIAFSSHPLTASERYQANRRSLRWLGLAGLVGYILMAAAFFTALYSIGQLPPARAYIIPQAALVLLAMAWGYIMGLGLQKKYAPAQPGSLSPLVLAAALALLMLGVLPYTAEVFSLVPDFQVYAAEWDARDTLLSTTDAQGAVITIQPFTVDLADYAWLPDQHESCIRDYYHQPTLVFPETEGAD
jgi:hypothetical protein